MKGGERLQLREQAPAKIKAGRKERSLKVVSDLSPEAQRRFDALRLLRLTFAHAQNVPPYVIFNDATLRDMAIADPSTPAQLLNINGVGEQKLARYGQAFLARLAEVRGLSADASLPYVEPNTAKIDTVEATFALITQGLTREQIAEQRGLSVDTIGGHLLKLYQAERISLVQALYLQVVITAFAFGYARQTKRQAFFSQNIGGFAFLWHVYFALAGIHRINIKRGIGHDKIALTDDFFAAVIKGIAELNLSCI